MPRQEFGPPLLTEMDRVRHAQDPLAQWRWVSSPGACVECLARDGRKFTYDAVPGRPHPHCNCTLAYVPSSSSRGGSQLGESPTTPAKENQPWPELPPEIQAVCRMETVGASGGAVCHLTCNVSTTCILDTRIDEKTFSGKQYSGTYRATLAGPSWALAKLGVTIFEATFQLPVSLSRYRTPLHAMNGWANIETAGFAVGWGGSISRLELGDTLSISVGGQYGVDLSASWFGWRGQHHLVQCHHLRPFL